MTTQGNILTVNNNLGMIGPSEHIWNPPVILYNLLLNYALFALTLHLTLKELLIQVL